MRTTLKVIICAYLFSSPVYAADLYKIVCDDGIITYSNVPPPSPEFSYPQKPNVICRDKTEEMNKAFEEKEKANEAKAKADVTCTPSAIPM